MTFEEFMAKKKIDLLQFKTAEPSLFSEFESHYSQMGPKSFDHSKKFLFNKIRRAYHLKEESKPVLVNEPIEINEIASQAEPLLSPSVAATVYTPRLKENQESGINLPGRQAGNQDSSEKRKPAYIPRFKSPAATNQEPPQAPPENSDLSPQTSDKPKPAYVPRFKPQTLKSPEASPEEETMDTQIEQAKPAFKPRFKPGITNTTEAKPIEEATDEDPADKPKPKYVPRFKPPQQ